MTQRRRLSKNNAPNPVDCYVGNKIRIRRTILNLSQKDMADKIGVSFQQVQKYETGQCRVSASQLWNIARILGTNIDYFFNNMKQEIQNKSPRMLYQQKANQEISRQIDKNSDPMKKVETLILVDAYYRISDRNVAFNMFNLIKSFATENYHLHSPQKKN